MSTLSMLHLSICYDRQAGSADAAARRTAGAAILAADAARCAVEIGRAVVGHNAEAPEKKRIAFRIGLNLGDIFADRRDINGDGVNIAARSGGGAILPRFMVCFTASQ